MRPETREQIESLGGKFLDLGVSAAGEGGYPYWHCELYPRDPGAETLHRHLLWTLYLNDGFRDGETEFLYQQRRIAPRARQPDVGQPVGCGFDIERRPGIEPSRDHERADMDRIDRGGERDDQQQGDAA